MTSLPEHLKQWLDGWGPDFGERLASALRASGCKPTLDAGRVLRLGADCSGIEAPVHALEALKVSHRWASEIAAGPREIMLANTPPEVLFNDVLVQDGFAPASRLPGSTCKRSRSSKAAAAVKQGLPEYVDLYISGFSCKPFSLLHHGTKLLSEPEAQIFWAVVSPQPSRPSSSSWPSGAAAAPA